MTIAKALGMKEHSTDNYVADTYDHGVVPGTFPGWQKGEFSDLHRQNLSLAASKRVRTPEHIKALHEGRRNSKNSAEHTAALVASRIGTTHTKEAKSKMSLAKKNNPDTKALASAAGRASAAKRALDPNYRLEQSRKSAEVWAKRRAAKEVLVNGD